MPILVVDDHEDTRQLLVEYMCFAGLPAIGACDGVQALEVAVRWRPRLILMDLSMPRMDGIETTRRLKSDARTRGIPVIAVTGEGGQAVADALRAGVAAVCEKPCALAELVSLVRRALRTD